ncbi:MAG: hypothetical protein H7332_13350 [Bdellovibrionales bacterium]|nr:hypothetical protein [Ramlibacter sp.]
MRGDRVIGTMLLRSLLLLLAFLPPLLVHGQTQLTAPVSAAPVSAAPVSAIWAGEWRAAEFNLPPINTTLTTRRNASTFEVRALIAGSECPLAYDGQLNSGDVIKRIEERAKWQLKPDNWPAGTDPAQLVGLKKEFDNALRLTRSLPPDTYRRVRARCAMLPSTDDRFYLLTEGRRLFEYRFPESGLSLNVTVYERVR